MDNNKYDRLIHHVIQRYVNPKDSNYDEYYSEALVALAYAIRKYDATKGMKFSTYAAKTIHSRMIGYWQQSTRKKRTANVISLQENDNIIDNIDVEESIIDKLEIERFMDFLSRQKERSKQIFHWLYGLNGEEEFSQVEISNMLGISYKRVNKIVGDTLSAYRTRYNIKKVV